MTIDFFKIDQRSKETFENSVRVAVQPYQSWCSVACFFKAPGEYAAYAYDEFGRLLGTTRLTLLVK